MGGGQPGGGAVRSRGGGVPALALGDQLDRGDALLGHPTTARGRPRAGTPRRPRRRPRRARTRARPRAGAARRPRRRRCCPRPPRSTRRTARRRAPDEALGQQRLHRRADADTAPLSSRVPRPHTAPSWTRRRRVGASRCPRPDDVEVGHQDDRPRRGPAGPAHEQGVRLDLDQLEAVQQREVLGQAGPQGEEGCRVRCAPGRGRRPWGAARGPEGSDRGVVLAHDADAVTRVRHPGCNRGARHHVTNRGDPWRALCGWLPWVGRPAGAAPSSRPRSTRTHGEPGTHRTPGVHPPCRSPPAG